MALGIEVMRARPPYVRFEIQTDEFRDPDGVLHTRDVERVLVTPAGTKEVFVGNAAEWIRNKRVLSQVNPEQFHPEWVTMIEGAFNEWRKGNAVPEFGTPIRGWPVLSPSEVKRCVAANILTVEDLAAANEQALANLGMGGRALKDKAATWMQEKAGAGHLVEKVAALETQNQELAALVRKQGDDLARATASMEASADAPARRGRRPSAPPEPIDDGPAIR